MKPIIWIYLLVLLLVPTLSQAGIIGPANIRFTDGDVMFRTPDDDEWLPAAVNTPLDEGDAIWCPDGSRTEIQLADGTVVRMDGGSELNLIANEDGFTHLHLESGRIYLRTYRTSGKDSLQIDAADTTVVPAARTRLRIDMLPNNQEDVSIFKGAAYVEGNGSRTKVRAGEHIALEEGRNELLPLSPADDWEYWNMDRDRAQSRSARVDSNLPDELHSYSADFDTNGKWVRVPEYGMVWRPTIILSADWAPYRSGRWIWKGDDYVWVSYEIWGWVPYHFGRWAVVAGFGWCWVPPTRGDVYWGPGYVGWYSTGSLVGWTPLAPGEIFYGRRNYGRHSAINTNMNINPANVIYRNRRSPGGLTVVQQHDFLRGRTVVQQPSQNASISVSVSLGSPRIKPLRETRMPVIKQTPPRVAPPRIEYKDSRELRNRFPRINQEPGPQRRSQQPAAAAPASQTPPVREKRTVFPAVTPDERKTVPDSKRHEAPSKRDDSGRRQTAPQPLPKTDSSTSGAVPQQSDQPRGINPPTVITPAAQPQQERSRRITSPVMTPREAAPKREERATKEVKEKKVWKVKTVENSDDKDNKEREYRPGGEGRKSR
ncbi:MAG: hypothetical protein HGB32_15795 [Geobacteraceae bacterium]|nr:hypothetical protein [Geobacteraceae bacterium]NTW81585.1 hypothetical protein [Geobacteraceae bacterium]